MKDGVCDSLCARWDLSEIKTPCSFSALTVFLSTSNFILVFLTVDLDVHVDFGPTKILCEHSMPDRSNKAT